jgi:type IV secretory pathway TrbD component
MEGTIMTPETKKSIYWTAGVLAALVVLVAILWLAGVFEVVPVQ